LILQNFGLTSPLPTVALAVTALVGVLTAVFIFQSASENWLYIQAGCVCCKFCSFKRSSIFQVTFLTLFWCNINILGEKKWRHSWKVEVMEALIGCESKTNVYFLYYVMLSHCTCVRSELRNLILDQQAWNYPCPFFL
jgi:hypothetical protein